MGLVLFRLTGRPDMLLFAGRYRLFNSLSVVFPQSKTPRAECVALLLTTVPFGAVTVCCGRLGPQDQTIVRTIG